MSLSRFPIGSTVELKDPLPAEANAVWKVVGVKFNVAPPLYKLQRITTIRPLVYIEADEGELQQVSNQH